MPEAVLQGIIAPAGHPAMGRGAVNLSEDSEQAGIVPLNITTMNQNSCSITVYEKFPLVQLGVYIPVLILGIFLNVLALWVFCCKLKKWTETKVYMVNLAVADCLLLFTLPFKTLSNFQQMKAGRWCLILESGYFINRLMSTSIITVVAADRYLAIKYPLKAKVLRSPVQASFACGFLWIVIISVMSLIKMIENREQDELCFEKSSAKPSVTGLCVIIGGFFIPLIIVIYCSVQVIAELLKKKNENCHEKKLIRKAAYIVTANMTVFTICFLPLYLGHLLRFIMDSISSSCPAIQRVNNFVHLASVLANTNCCLDAICYYFVNKEFKEASPKLVKSKSESTEDAEIQLPTR
uniref:G-protein coupled receptors family 1 profile domain-containing protein n=1 Tax=Cairina moschata TaxID=8855 RepID=A0A8C3B7R0_CAIMO